ncbi:MAG TPA: deoxyhypusine synthase [Deltaproteobacteria bacterium]|nr:deoxyhypusine synthase [Deltaproteobacteria bacterium]
MFDLKARRRFLDKPVDPVRIDPSNDVSALLRGMASTAFQGKNLALAADVWEEMLRAEATVLFGLAGAMVPAGMRRVMVHLIEKRRIDCLVSTGANLFHDIHETLGRRHWQGTPHVNDSALRDAGLDRMYDVYAKEEEFNDTDKYIYDFAAGLERRPYSTREFFRLMGEDLCRAGSEEGILTAAFKAGVHVYCPALGDSSIGIALAMHDGDDRNVIFDIIGDVRETAHIVSTAPATGIVFVGGGTPKNYIQQTEVTADMMRKHSPGHKYAVQVTSDAPHWGGLSGCTFEESQSWGKIARDSRRVTVNCDATIALPILATALSQRLDGYERKLPDMSLEGAQRVESRIWQ